MRKKKSKPRLPTVDEFLQYRPKRLDFEWYINEEHLVKIKVPKFKSNVGKSLCKLVRKDQMFTANMDKLGSIIWQQCDGATTVQQILDILRKEFPTEPNIDQRLFLFIQQMGSLGYLLY